MMNKNLLVQNHLFFNKDKYKIGEDLEIPKPDKKISLKPTEYLNRHSLGDI